MAITTNIPPQAYTRDTLVKAIEWISHQSPAVRERANSADLIVSFYLQARRRMTAAQLEAPVSGENFKQDLKHLAQNLKQFEESPAPPTTTPNRSLPSSQVSNGAHGNFDSSEPIQFHPLANHNHLHAAPSPQVHSHSQAHSHPQQHVHLHVQQAAPTAQPQVAPLPPTQHLQAIQWAVDDRSLTFARELQQRFNLSNESEALRMLVTLGIERARDLFP